MKPVDMLKKLGLCSWSTLIIGWSRGWATRKDIIDYAVGLLSENEDSCNDDVVLLAGGETFDDEDFRKLVKNLTTDESSDDEVEMDKWRLAHLLCLAESNLDEQTKIDRLQDIYAEFNYPQDMTSCSIYSEGSDDPIETMMNIINQLSQRFQP